ncbi:UvrD-helicase domain-containing protein, partial [Candidatus Saccharibacteria bacterium]|nr:UvrD-helicase domain-containing protein [Candidatus Saccharibacteria bacterium]
MNILEGLNDAQKQAVTAGDGPLLILAGAGSGKTKTLTHRIAYLLHEKQVWPNQVLAVTFTNKAAGEMRQRLWQLVEPTAHTTPPPRSFMPWMGTFHGICVRLLRLDGQAIGVPANFVIYDEDDRQGLIKQAMKSLGTNDSSIKPKVVSSAISTAKNQMIGPDEFERSANYPFQKSVAKLYREYEKQRVQAKALDFDDLLLETVHLLKDMPQIREKWQQQFRYVLIDEYQDTNAAQYQIVRALVGEQHNICVVGDDWQSIYSWRGADFTNILNFEKDFPGALVIKLEQNYRSTNAILTAAQRVIQKNKQRTDKKLWTAEGEGSPVQVHQLYDEVEEATTIASRIAASAVSGNRSPADFAVLYRTNAQSYTLERALLQMRIPYHIVGGVRFYDRKEIKDILAYLKLLYQPNDRMSFSRIVNVPTRGIGPTSVERFLNWQAATGLDIVDAMLRVDEADGLTPRAKNAMKKLGETLHSLATTMADGLEPSLLIEYVLKDVGYLAHVRDGSPLAEDREQNIGSLVSDAKTFASLEDLLSEAALMSSSDEAAKGPSVTLMTLHAAKGLEFPVVF